VWITSWTPFFAGRSLLQIGCVLHHWKSAPTDDALNACPLVYVVIWTKEQIVDVVENVPTFFLSPSLLFQYMCELVDKTRPSSKTSGSWPPTWSCCDLGCMDVHGRNQDWFYQTISDSTLQHDNIWQHFANDMDHARQQHHFAFHVFPKLADDLSWKSTSQFCGPGRGTLRRVQHGTNHLVLTQKQDESLDHMREWEECLVLINMSSSLPLALKKTKKMPKTYTDQRPEDQRCTTFLK
jgi:hypothetical protein